VGDRVDDFEVVRKGACSDLVVVGRVPPSTEPARRGIVEDGCVGKVGTGIYEVKASVWRGPVDEQTDPESNPSTVEHLDSHILSSTRPQNR